MIRVVHNRLKRLIGRLGARCGYFLATAGLRPSQASDRQVSNSPVVAGFQPFFRFACIAALSLAVPVISMANDADDRVANWLATAGYASNAYETVMVWQETAPATGDVITGVHLQNLDGGTAEDVYFDASGARLDSPTLKSLGVVAKRWASPGTETFAETHLAPALAATRSPQPVAMTKSASARVTLPPLDYGLIAYEDAMREASDEKAALRTGVFQGLPSPVYVTDTDSTHGSWTELPDGTRVWSLAVASPDAVGIRVRFTELYMPAGAELVLYNASNPDEIYGPFHEIPEGNTEWWSPTVFGETVTIECRVAPNRDTAGMAIGIDQVVHQYVDIAEAVYDKQAGACNLDVACFPDYATTARGIVGLGAITQSGSLYCTGTLIADSEPDTQIPYLLTANHCIATQSRAGTTEVYWFYQRSACDGTVPNISSVPRSSSGMDYLAGSSVTTGTDVTLLQMRDTPPATATFVGWSSMPWPLGTEVACIHHPRGSYKRISFSEISNEGSPIEGDRLGRPIDRYHEAIWSSGITEPASSGSPMILQETQQIIGQLWGGLASCSLPDEPDYYGRFDVSFVILAPWLGGDGGPADVNGDSLINAEDVQMVINVVIGKIAEFEAADVDNSGAVDAVDIQLVINAVLNQFDV